MSLLRTRVVWNFVDSNPQGIIREEEEITLGRAFLLN